MAASQSEKLGIVAGSGAIPRLLINACRTAARPYFVIGLKGFATEAELGQMPDAWIRIGETGKGFALMTSAGVREVVMVGAVRRPTWRTLWPDLRTLSFFIRLAGRARGDNSLLSAAVKEIESEGFRVVGADTVLTDLLATKGALGRIQPNEKEQTDIMMGIAAARDHGRRDLGQAVIVNNGQVTDVEGVDGTDALIKRAQGTAPGGVLVKMKKPQQERRVDLPTIGVETVRNAANAGLRGIAIEAGHTLVVDRAGVAAAADAAGVFVVGIEQPVPARKDSPFIYVVAAEPSGDQLGALLITALMNETQGKAHIVGVGGPAMAEVGLKSLFDPAELALLGIFEVVPKVLTVLRRVRETVADIEAKQPDILVTIDSWGFTGRIHERLTKNASIIQRVRYVAPQVWAWRPGRAKQLARWINHLMTLFPFEPPYFTKFGLNATWVGHPVLESGADKGDSSAFRKRYNIANDETILVVLPGSRNSEITRLLGLFGATVGELSLQIPRLRVVIPTVPNVAGRVRAGVAGWPGKPIIVESAHERFDAFAAGRAALAASGTVSLELAMASLPHVIAYKVNPLSAFVLAWLIKTKYFNLINVLLNRVCVLERMQGNARADILAKDLRLLITDDTAREAMKAEFKLALAKLSPGGQSPSQRAARTVLDLISKN